MTPKFCSNCGTSLAENAKFCSECGFSIGGHMPPAQPEEIHYARKKIPGRGYGITSMVLGIIGLLYCSLLLISLIASTNLMYTVAGITFADIAIAPIIIYAVFPILATIFGNVAQGRKYVNGISNSGIAMGIIGLSVSLVSLVLAFCLRAGGI